MLIWILTALSIIGAAWVATGHPIRANIVWSISNPALVLYNLTIVQTAQAVMFGIFSLIAFYGIYNLKIKPSQIKCKSYKLSDYFQGVE